jgi:hypothetical protein
LLIFLKFIFKASSAIFLDGGYLAGICHWQHQLWLRILRKLNWDCYFCVHFAVQLYHIRYWYAYDTPWSACKEYFPNFLKKTITDTFKILQYFEIQLKNLVIKLFIQLCSWCCVDTWWSWLWNIKKRHGYEILVVTYVSHKWWWWSFLELVELSRDDLESEVMLLDLNTKTHTSCVPYVS